jgi:hypothetical protein
MRLKNLFAILHVFRHVNFSRLPRWKGRLLFILALLLPGVPQLLRKQFVVGSLLLVGGSGVILNLLICAYLSIFGNVFKSFDLLYTIAMPNVSVAFPNLQLLGVEPAYDFTQPYFWQLLVGHIALYVVCAALSVWQQWKQDVNDKD